MIKNTILTYEDIRHVNNGHSDEKLVDVRSYDKSIIAQYEKFDMVAYTGFEILVRETVAKKLASVNKQLKSKYDLTLKVVYGYRALEVQTRYFNKRQAEIASENPDLQPDELTALTHSFVAVPEIAGHVTGGAVDVTMINASGINCAMGTKIADYTDENRIKTFSNSISARQQKLRQILLSEMMSENFAPFLGEWWHFSFGDKEWAAYYKKPKAIYNPISMDKTAKVIKIAGGNETVLQVIRRSVKKNFIKQAGESLLNTYSNAEQAGLLFADKKRLEMAGGEFCGNASAAAAILLVTASKKTTVSYNVSGFKGKVTAEVKKIDRNQYQVRTSFMNMNYKIKTLTHKGKQLAVVDMKGIVHILIDDVFPEKDYEQIQRELINELNLFHHKAVGVIWFKKDDEKIQINPVVWVKKIDTLFYESACGSGAIATALHTGIHNIVQPTGEYINVYIDVNKVTTECRVVST